MTGCLKSRSDILFTSRIDVDNYLRISELNELGVLRRKILTTKTYTRAFFVHRGKIEVCPGHLSDQVQFGCKDDIYTYWEGEYLREEDFYSRIDRRKTFTPEQALFFRFLRKYNYDYCEIDPYYEISGDNFSTLTDVLNLISKYFLVQEECHLGVALPQRMKPNWYKRNLLLTADDIDAIIANGRPRWYSWVHLLAMGHLIRTFLQKLQGHVSNY